MRKPLLLASIFAITAVAAQAEPLMTLEAEAAVLTPPVKVKHVNGYSGNAYVGDFDKGSEVRFNHVRVDNEGTYEIRVYYTSMFMRSVNVTVNSYPAVNIPMTRETPEWDRPPVYMMLSYIWLDKGDNTIVLTPPANDAAPNIDKIELWETPFSMPKPEIKEPAFPYDLTDDAVSISIDGEPAEESDACDNSIFSIHAKGGKTGYVEYVLDQPHLITGYLFSEGIGADRQGNDWTLEYSTDGRTYTTMHPSGSTSLGNATLFYINRQPHADRNSAARYYRVNTRGRDIAEIQLFGFPYIASGDNRNFPADMTEGLDIEKCVNGTPLGATGWADERCYNLFNRDMQTKYYTDESRTGIVEIELDKAMTLESYTLTSCQDYPERDPRTWIMEGFDMSWEPISEVHDFEFPCRYATMRFDGETSKLYRGFRLRITGNNGADRFQLLKLQLFGSDITGVEDVAASTSGISVSPGSGCVTLASDTHAHYTIYGADGCAITSGNACGTESILLPAGFYIIICDTPDGHSATKVVVR